MPSRDPQMLERQNRRVRRQARYGPNFNLNDATPEQLYQLESADIGSDLLPNQAKRRRNAIARLALRTGGTTTPKGWAPAAPPRAPEAPHGDLLIGHTGKPRPGADPALIRDLLARRRKKRPFQNPGRPVV